VFLVQAQIYFASPHEAMSIAVRYAAFLLAGFPLSPPLVVYSPSPIHNLKRLPMMLDWNDYQKQIGA
jgi:hypothetical protein